jgi:hypothetical protein
MAVWRIGDNPNLVAVGATFALTISKRTEIAIAVYCIMCGK